MAGLGLQLVMYDLGDGPPKQAKTTSDATPLRFQRISLDQIIFVLEMACTKFLGDDTHAHLCRAWPGIYFRLRDHCHILTDYGWLIQEYVWEDRSKDDDVSDIESSSSSNGWFPLCNGYDSDGHYIYSD